MLEYLNEKQKRLSLAITWVFIGLILGFLIAYLTAEPKPGIKEMKFDENFKTLLN